MASFSGAEWLSGRNALHQFFGTKITTIALNKRRFENTQIPNT
jgi:hypothetical protein